MKKFSRKELLEFLKERGVRDITLGEYQIAFYLGEGQGEFIIVQDDIYNFNQGVIK